MMANHSLFPFYRNRLENNSDHWNALFLSLRELAEWTVKKETELEAMSPIGGDEATIRKQQVYSTIMQTSPILRTPESFAVFCHGSQGYILSTLLQLQQLAFQNQQRCNQFEPMVAQF